MPARAAAVAFDDPKLSLGSPFNADYTDYTYYAR